MKAHLYTFIYTLTVLISLFIFKVMFCKIVINCDISHKAGKNVLDILGN